MTDYADLEPDADADADARPALSFGITTKAYPFRFDVFPADYGVTVKVGKAQPLVLCMQADEAAALGKALVAAATVATSRAKGRGGA